MADVISMAAHRRKVAARLVRAQRSDTCAHCGALCDVSERLAADSERNIVMHMRCYFAATGMETSK